MDNQVPPLVGNVMFWYALNSFLIVCLLAWLGWKVHKLERFRESVIKGFEGFNKAFDGAIKERAVKTEGTPEEPLAVQQPNEEIQGAFEDKPREIAAGPGK